MPAKRSVGSFKTRSERRTAEEVNMANMDNINSRVKIPTYCGSHGESAKFWLAKFEQVMKLKKVNNEDKTIQLFLLLEGQAEMWYHTLSEDIQGNYKKLRDAFVERFLPSESDRIRDVGRFRALCQTREESTDDYIEKVIRMGRDLEKSEREITDQIFQGLQPGIMKFVAQKEPETLVDVRKFARMGQSLEKDVSMAELNRIQGRRGVTQTGRGVTQTGKCDFQYSDRNRYQNRGCYICQRTSHIARDCWYRKDRK